MAAGRLFLGVDGGQSSTKAVVGDVTGRVLGRGRAGPCNHASKEEGREKLRSAISAVVAGALAEAGLAAETRFEAACFGMSGGADDKRDLISEFVCADLVRVVNDAEVALEGATQGEPGAVVIAGTGCIGLARHRTGKTVRCGGWGYLFGDDGGAFGVVRSALQRALAAEEGWAHPTKLTDLFCDATGTDSVNKAMHCFYGPDWPRDRIASLAPAVDAAAEGGDEPAAAVLRRAGLVLGNLVIDLADACCANGMFLSRVPTRYCGGVFRSSRVLESFKYRCREKDCLIAAPMHDGATGALLLAYGVAGVSVLERGLR